MTDDQSLELAKWGITLAWVGIFVSGIGAIASILFSIGLGYFLYVQGQINMVHLEIRYYFDTLRRFYDDIGEVCGECLFENRWRIDQRHRVRLDHATEMIVAEMNPHFFRLYSMMTPFADNKTTKQLADLQNCCVETLTLLNGFPSTRRKRGRSSFSRCG